jgi:hypothetical protein
LSEQTDPGHAAKNGPFAVRAYPVRDGVPYCLSADQLEMSRVLFRNVMSTSDASRAIASEDSAANMAVARREVKARDAAW